MVKGGYGRSIDGVDAMPQRCSGPSKQSPTVRVVFGGVWSLGVRVLYMV